MNKAVNAADWGILPGDHEKTTEKFGELMKALEGQTGIVLRMEPGEYHFYPQLPLKKLHISNHDACDGLAVGLSLKGIRDFTLDGGGSRWIFHTGMLPVHLENCNGLLLKKFSVDYHRPVYSQGEILEVSRQRMLVRIDGEKYPWYAERDRLIFQGEDCENAVHLCLEMDANTRGPAYGTEDLYFCTETQKVGRHPRFRAVSKDVAEISLEGEECFFAGSRPGNLLIFRHYPRTAPAIYAADSEDITCEGIRIHHAPGMGLLAERCENVSLKQVEVLPREETGRCFSVAADATHFVNCSGKIRLQDCRFESQMDDGVNVHGLYAVVCGRTDDYRLQLDWGHVMQRGVCLAKAGDELALMRADELRPFWRGKLKGIRTDQEGKMEAETEDVLPVLPQGRLVAENLTRSPAVFVENCVFRRNRARGVLLTCKNALVENCLFETSGAAVYLEGEAEYWYESGAVRELIFRKNRFVDCSYVPEWGGAPIVACPKVTCGEGSFFHGRVVLEENEFSCFDERLLQLRQVGEICMKKNRYIATKTYPTKPGKRFDIAECGSFQEDWG